MHKVKWWFWNLLRIRKIFCRDWWKVRKVAKTCKPITTKISIMPRPICVGYLISPSLTYEESDFRHRQVFWVDVPSTVLNKVIKEAGPDYKDGRITNALPILEFLKELGYKSRQM